MCVWRKAISTVESGAVAGQYEEICRAECNAFREHVAVVVRIESAQIESFGGADILDFNEFLKVVVAEWIIVDFGYAQVGRQCCSIAIVRGDDGAGVRVE